MLGMALVALAVSCSPTVMTHGVPNLARVDGGVWRSGQISTAEGWNYLLAATHAKRLHVIKLNFDNEGSDALAVNLGIDVHVISIQPQGDQDLWDDIEGAFAQPDPMLIDKAEELLSGATTDDVWLVHCTHGQDRTGLVIGRHRVLHDGWTKDAAYAEMLLNHFHPELHGVHEAWENFKAP